MTTPLDEAAVRDALKQVIDPEVGMNIVDLGLIYTVALTDTQITVEMTMTSPACPMGQMIMDEVDAALHRLAPDHTPAVELVWQPEWTPAMMSDTAKAHFGWQADDV
ncbi:metal-sulfur cluster assembly factor [Denitromonas halophila]|uniref:Metal-sulfur cluster assembly factor n=1 Tax=Denitromonas halophila TaxID=1629404 RepID=A0A557QG98_9RHOO|nr:metal-sulfur cluster assembly factor [Denitromonas halophila]TVO51935.1 metal-sulfur cluster assembly factor [Denitromonas halophila]